MKMKIATKEDIIKTLKNYEVEYLGFTFVIEEIKDSRDVVYRVYNSNKLDEEVLTKFKQLSEK